MTVDLMNTFVTYCYLLKFTMRASGIRRRLAGLLSGVSLQSVDLNAQRLHSVLEEFNFASRPDEAAGSSADVAFTLHGTTVMFYHFNRQSFDKIISCKLLSSCPASLSYAGVFYFTQL